MTGRALTQPELCELAPPPFYSCFTSTLHLHLHLHVRSFNYSIQPPPPPLPPSIPYVFLVRGPSTHQRTRLCTHVLLLCTFQNDVRGRSRNDFILMLEEFIICLLHCNWIYVCKCVSFNEILESDSRKGT